MTWEDSHASWWLEEIAGDPSYERDVDPMLRALVPPGGRGPILDLGCGEGRSLGRFGRTVGVDLLPSLAAVAAGRGPVVIADAAQGLPFADATFDGVYAVLVLEHVPDATPVISEMARVVRGGGWCVVVHNHPVLTAPDSGPVVDVGDGEVLWRWGEYLGGGHTDEPAGTGTVRFHHRTVAALLTGFADQGWDLERVIEARLGAMDDPLFYAQRFIPRLFGARWRRRG
ncbi:MAG: methyltransferase domain-containing protein [Acidimicrobiia bacterium]|nr:methyltransferase domain-containing protein [Acidimicrobiia bacterium]